MTWTCLLFSGGKPRKHNALAICGNQPVRRWVAAYRYHAVFDCLPATELRGATVFASSTFML